MTTAHDIGRAGRPRIFDEDELLERISSLEDLALIRVALVDVGFRPATAGACASWLSARKLGDPTGGVSLRSASRYRSMLAEIPHDPLRPPGGRRRALRELANQRGGAEFALLAGGAAAGALALAFLSPSEALRAAALVAAPIMRDGAESAAQLQIPGLLVPVGPPATHGSRECVPGVRQLPAPVRVECAPELVVEAA